MTLDEAIETKWELTDATVAGVEPTTDGNSIVVYTWPYGFSSAEDGSVEKNKFYCVIPKEQLSLLAHLPEKICIVPTALISPEPKINMPDKLRNYRPSVFTGFYYKSLPHFKSETHENAEQKINSLEARIKIIERNSML
jgi:hypothetical protein